MDNDNVVRFMTAGDKVAESSKEILQDFLTMIESDEIQEVVLVALTKEGQPTFGMAVTSPWRAIGAVEWLKSRLAAYFFQED